MPSVPETKLQIYNDALELCEERLLATLTENRKPRRELDNVWNNGGGINACLEEGDWSFARRTVQAVADPNMQASFGYTHAFQHPPDWLRTTALAPDPYFTTALTQVRDENGYWWADLDKLYVIYVSNDPAYGFDLTKWPESFKKFVAAEFADRIVGTITHSESIKAKVAKAKIARRLSALGKDGMNEPPGFFPRGQLVRARQGYSFGRPDRSGGIF